MESVPLSVTYITRNEAHQLERSIRSASWANEVLVVDSGSTDGTQALAQKLGAKVIQKEWLGFGKQKNLAQDLASNDWVLNLDADEVLTDELSQEIRTWIHSQEQARRSGAQAGVLSIPRKNFFGDRWVRFGGWYPNYVVRVGHRSSARWTEPYLHEQLRGEGLVTFAQNPLLHFTFKSISHQVQTNLRYAQEGAMEMRRQGKKFSMIRIIFKPIGKFLETYFWKMGLLDGRMGLIISVSAAYSMFLKQAFLLEQKQENAN
ncbi:MAG: glycosyltransferase family 2 protein [Bdellovibrionales bacterium]|nr:glycosyltransferase family 2 protein [Bdellovibrionales bacterium]